MINLGFFLRFFCESGLWVLLSYRFVPTVPIVLVQSDTDCQHQEIILNSWRRIATADEKYEGRSMNTIQNNVIVYYCCEYENLKYTFCG